VDLDALKGAFGLIYEGLGWVGRIWG